MKVQRPERAAPDRGRPQLMLYQAARIVKERVRALDFIDAARARRRVRRARSGRSSTTGTRRATPRRSAGTSPATARARPARLLELHAGARAHARAARGRPARATSTLELRRSRSARELAYRDRRGVDDDDLPARLLPRRPAPGEHPRARATTASASSTSASPGSSPTTTCPAADAALHRRRDRERRGAAAAARRPRRPLPEGARGGVRAELDELYYRYYGARLSEIDPIAGDPRGLRRSSTR